MRRLAVIMAFVLAPAVAVAQGSAEKHEGEHAGAHAAGEGTDEAGGHHGHHDPSKHFNYFDIGYKKKDVYGGKYGDGVQGPHDEPEEPMSPPFAFMLINFGILLVILAKYGGPAAKKMAESRSDQIKSALDEAAKLRQAAADRLEEYNGKLAAAEAEMKTMIENMRADAAAEKARILAAAEAQAIAMKKDAELRIAAEIALARATLTREVATAAANAAEQIIKTKATAGDHTKLVDTFVADVGRQAGTGAS
jgi:F-type H+-transporting ATPase subunit b